MQGYSDDFAAIACSGQSESCGATEPLKCKNNPFPFNVIEWRWIKKVFPDHYLWRCSYWRLAYGSKSQVERYSVNINVTPWSVSPVFVLVSTPLQVSPVFPIIPSVFIPVFSVASSFCSSRLRVFFPWCWLVLGSVFPFFWPLCLLWPRDCLPFCALWTLIWITDLCLPLTCRFAWPLF